MCQAMLHTLPHLDIIHLILYKVRAGESAHQHHTVDDRTRICTCVWIDSKLSLSFFIYKYHNLYKISLWVLTTDSVLVIHSSSCDLLTVNNFSNQQNHLHMKGFTLHVFQIRTLRDMLMDSELEEPSFISVISRSAYFIPQHGKYWISFLSGCTTKTWNNDCMPFLALAVV